VALAAACLLPASLPADEAVLLDGRRLPGELVTGPGGSLQFRPARGGANLTLDQLAFVRFPSSSPLPSRFPLVHQIVLRDGQRLTGEFLGIDERSVRLRTGWSGPLTLPRAAVAAVVQPRSLMTTFVDDFEDGLVAWTTTGQPTCGDREHTSGHRGLCLDASGQSAAYTLSVPLEAGQAAINFLDVDVSPGVRGQLELVFQSPNGPQSLRMTAVDGASKAATVEWPTGIRSGTRAAQVGGWRRLRVEFSPALLQVLVDDLVLYSSRRQGPGGPLREVRIVRESGGKQAGGAKTEIWFDDFGLARRVQELARPDGGANKDELWLLSGDQLFGSIPRADRRTIELQARFGKQSRTWAEVRGIWLRQEPWTAPPAAGGQVRMRLSQLDGLEPDQLDGMVAVLEPKRLVLRHDLLGDLTMPREWVQRLERRPAK
jgi:hypothetical protein